MSSMPDGVLDRRDARTRAAHDALGPYAQVELERAAQHALRLHADAVSPEHLFTTVMADEDSAAHRVVVFGFGDPVPVAKVLVKFRGDHEALSIKGAVLEGEYLTADAVKQLAELPSREELLGQLLSLMQAPATRLLRTMNEPAARVTQLVEVLRRKLEEGSGGG